MKNYVSNKKLNKVIVKGDFEKLNKLYNKQVKLTEKRCEKNLRKFERFIDNEMVKLEVLNIEAMTLKEYVKASIEIDNLKEELLEVENEEIKKMYDMTIEYIKKMMKIMGKTMDKCSELINKEPEYMVI